MFAESIPAFVISTVVLMLTESVLINLLPKKKQNRIMNGICTIICNVDMRTCIDAPTNPN